MQFWCRSESKLHIFTCQTVYPLLDMFSIRILVVFETFNLFFMSLKNHVKIFIPVLFNELSELSGGMLSCCFPVLRLCSCFKLVTCMREIFSHVHSCKVYFVTYESNLTEINKR